MIDQIKIGQFIAAQRKSQGYTQAALAEKLGITDRAAYGGTQWPLLRP
jgi:transcriptional regulator with XRE-family HTH domain